MSMHLKIDRFHAFILGQVCLSHRILLNQEIWYGQKRPGYIHFTWIQVHNTAHTACFQSVNIHSSAVPGANTFSTVEECVKNLTGPRISMSALALSQVVLFLLLPSDFSSTLLLLRWKIPNTLSAPLQVYEDYLFFGSLVSRKSILLRFYACLDVEELAGNDETRLMMEQAYTILMAFSNKSIHFSKSDFFRLFGRVKINAFHLTNDFGDEIGVALFERFVFLPFRSWTRNYRSAKLDHSCLPNADFAFVGKRIKVIASDEILDASQVSSTLAISRPPFPQIRISYVDLLMSMKRRQEELLNGYFFICNCPRCSDLEQVGFQTLTGLVIGFRHSNPSVLWGTYATYKGRCTGRWEGCSLAIGGKSSSSLSG